MKKIFLLLAMVLFSVNVFADSRSCQVYGTNGIIVSVDNPTSTANWQKRAISTVKLSSYNNTGRTITVVVNCYDIRGNYVASKEINIHHNTDRGYTWFHNLEEGMVYQFKINSASCQ